MKNKLMSFLLENDVRKKIYHSRTINDLLKNKAQLGADCFDNEF